MPITGSRPFTFVESSVKPLASLDVHEDATIDSWCWPISDVTFIPRAPQNPPQNDDATRVHDLKRRAHDIARDSQSMEDQIRAMVSSYMAPDEDDEDPELMIGRLVC